CPHSGRMLRSVIIPAVAFALLAGCGDKTFAPGSAGEATQVAVSDAEADSAEDESGGNISQDLLDKLKDAANQEEAAVLEEEIWDAWLVSGSATVDTLMQRGLQYQQMQDLQGARDAFDKAIAILPDYAEAWNR